MGNVMHCFEIQSSGLRFVTGGEGRAASSPRHSFEGGLQGSFRCWRFRTCPAASAPGAPASGIRAGRRRFHGWGVRGGRAASRGGAANSAGREDARPCAGLPGGRSVSPGRGCRRARVSARRGGGRASRRPIGFITVGRHYARLRERPGRARSKRFGRSASGNTGRRDADTCGDRRQRFAPRAGEAEIVGADDDEKPGCLQPLDGGGRLFRRAGRRLDGDVARGDDDQPADGGFGRTQDGKDRPKGAARRVSAPPSSSPARTNNTATMRRSAARLRAIA
jgi:hypothetical protein